MGLSESHNLWRKTENFQLLFFDSGMFLLHMYMTLDQKVSLKYLSFARNQRKCVISLKSQFLIIKSCFGCCVHKKGVTLVLLGQVDVSVSRDGLQLKFYSLLVKLFRNQAISEANIGHMKNRSCNFFFTKFFARVIFYIY